MTTNKILAARVAVFVNQVDIYPVSCEKLANGRTDLEWLDNVLAGGARIVQLRDKISDDRALYEKALAFRRRTTAAGALFLVNNRLDIAILAEADGVHLGNSDIPVEAARQLAPEMLIGISTNSKEQAASAEARGASYYNIGPIFETKTKSGLTDFVGIEAIKTYSTMSRLPFTVMGGIKFNHLPDLTAHGARRIAVVTALTQAADITAETARWSDTIQRQIALN